MCVGMWCMLRRSSRSSSSSRAASGVRYPAGSSSAEFPLILTLYQSLSIPQLGDVHKGNALLLHFPLVVSGRGQFFPVMLASGTSGSEPFQGEYPHSHM